jgi:hypothetical protein
MRHGPKQTYSEKTKTGQSNQTKKSGSHMGDDEDRRES